MAENFDSISYLILRCVSKPQYMNPKQKYFSLFLLSSSSVNFSEILLENVRSITLGSNIKI